MRNINNPISMISTPAINTIMYEDDKYILSQICSNRNGIFQTYYKFSSLSVKQIISKTNLPNRPKLFLKFVSKINIFLVLLGFIFSLRKIFLIASKKNMLPVAAFSIGAGGDIGNLYIYNSVGFYRLTFLSTGSLKKAILKASENLINQKLYAIVKIDSPIIRYLSQLGFSQASKDKTYRFLRRTRPLAFSPFRIIVWKFMAQNYQALYLHLETLK